MDKYEYRIRAEEINSLIEQQEYTEAVKIADTIDWRRVRSVVMLCKVSELYKMNRRYEDSKEVLLLAYDLQPGSRKIIYSLCELSIKLEETVQAVEYYKEFVQVAPRDTGRFILQYRLYEAQDVSLEERIAVLEEYKKRDYREKWAYELAYLYHRIGLATRCVEECDELILWFGEGKYVLKAMELKMLHAPLTLQQQEKYNARFLSEMEAIAAVEEESRAQEEIPPFMPIEIKSIEATKAKTAEIPAKQVRGGAQSEQEQDDPEQTKEMPVRITEEDEKDEEAVLSDRLVIEEIAEQDAAYPAGGEDAQESLAQESEESDVSEEDTASPEDADMKIVQSMDDLDIHVKTIDVDDEYSTINLQEALAKDLAQLFAQEDMEASDATKALPIGSLAAASQLLSQGGGMPVEAVSLQGQAAKEPEEIFFQEEETEEADGDAPAEIEEAADNDIPAAVEEETGYTVEPQPEIEEVLLQEAELEEEPVSAEAEEAVETEDSAALVEIGQEANSDAPAETEQEVDSDIPAAVEEETRYIVEPQPEIEEVLLQEAETEETDSDAPAEIYEQEANNDIPAAVEEEIRYVIEPLPDNEKVLLQEAETEQEEEPVSAEAEEAAETEDSDALVEIEQEADSDILSEIEQEVGYEVEEEPEHTDVPAEMEEEADNDIPTEVEEEVRYVIEPLPDNEEVLLQEAETEPEVEQEADNDALAEIELEADNDIPAEIEQEVDNDIPAAIKEEPVVQETQPPRELEPLIFSNNAPLPEALIQAMQTVAIEAAKEAALAAAKEAAKETASAFQAMQPETVKEGPAIREVIEPQKEEPEEPKAEQTVEKQITGQLSFTDIMGEWEKTKKANEEKHLEEMKQRVMEQTGPLFSDFDSLTMTNSQDELTMLSPMLDVFSETEDLANEVEQALAEETQEAVRGSYADAPAVRQTVWPQIQPDIQPQQEIQEQPELQPQQNIQPQSQEQSELPLQQDMPQPDIQPQPEIPPQPDMPQQQIQEQPEIQQQVQEQPDNIDHMEDRPNSFNTAEINGLEEKLMTALSDQHYETSDMQVAALSAELSARESQNTDVQQKAQNPQSTAVQQAQPPVSDSPRFLTKTEKEIFGTIAQTRELQQKLAASLDAISMNPVSGNVIVTGEKGVGALEIAQSVAGYLAQERPHFTGNIQTYTFEDLKRKDIIATLDMLGGGVMIIDKAGDLTQQACVTLTNALQNMSGKGIVVILVDTKADIDRLQRSFARLTEFFSVAIDITTLDNNGLVNFGKEYAKQQDYSIDTMGVLALYNRIEERQTVDHAVTVEEVKGIVNEAIQSAEKKNVSHFMDVIFAKRYDKDDMVVLHEKDFLNEK